MDETVEEKVDRLNKESTSVAPYNKEYPLLFNKEKEYLSSILPSSIVKRIEHFGSTAIPEISAKPIVDMLVEVSSLDETKKKIVPILESLGYDYLWRPTIGMEPPWYAWFIKRDASGKRTHHIHMIESDFKMWDRLLFRDYLREFSAKAKMYDDLKSKLSEQYPNDREAYTKGKTTLVIKLTEEARQYYIAEKE